MDIPDLSRAKLLDPPPEARLMAELAGGLRCIGCRQRIEDGWEYVIYEFEMVEGRPTATAKRFSVCGQCGVEEAIAEAATARTRLEVDWLRPDSAANGDPQQG